MTSARSGDARQRKWFRLACGAVLFLSLFGLTRRYWCPEVLQDLILGFQGYVWAVLVYLGVAVGIAPRFSRKNLFRACTLLAVLLAGLCAVEVLLRFFWPSPPFIETLAAFPNMHQRIVGIPLKGVSPSCTFSTNSWGMRGGPVPADRSGLFTILTVGGSTTLCMLLDDSKTWPFLFQERLKQEGIPVWVGNAGFNGHTTRGHLRVMRDIVPHVQPDALVFLTGVNDLALSLDEKQYVYGRVHDSLWTRNDARENPWMHSRVWQVLSRWGSRMFQGIPEKDAILENGMLPRPLPPGNRPKLPKDLRELLPSLPEYRDNLREIIRLGKAQHCQMLFLTQPLLYDDTEYWRGIEGRIEYLKGQKRLLSAATVWRMMDLFNQALAEVCQDEKVPCFDLAGAVPHSREYFYDFCHYTEAGAELVAQLVTEAARENFNFTKAGITVRRAPGETPGAKE